MADPKELDALLFGGDAGPEPEKNSVDDILFGEPPEAVPEPVAPSVFPMSWPLWDDDDTEPVAPPTLSAPPTVREKLDPYAATSPNAAKVRSSSLAIASIRPNFSGESTAGFFDLIGAAGSNWEAPFEGIREELRKKGELAKAPLWVKGLLDAGSISTGLYTLFASAASAKMEDAWGLPPGVFGEATGGYVAPWTYYDDMKRLRAGEAPSSLPFVMHAAQNHSDFSTLDKVLADPTSMDSGVSEEAIERYERNPLVSMFGGIVPVPADGARWLMLDTLRKLGMRNKVSPLNILAQAVATEEDVPELLRSAAGPVDPRAYARMFLGGSTLAEGILGKPFWERLPGSKGVEWSPAMKLLGFGSGGLGMQGAGSIPTNLYETEQREKFARTAVLRAAKQGRLGKEVKRNPEQFLSMLYKLNDPDVMGITDTHSARYVTALSHLPEVVVHGIKRAHGTPEEQDKYINENPGFYLFDRILPIIAIGRLGQYASRAVATYNQIGIATLNGLKAFAKEADAMQSASSLRGVAAAPVEKAIAETLVILEAGEAFVTAGKAAPAMGPLGVVREVLMDTPAKRGVWLEDRPLLAIEATKPSVTVGPLLPEVPVGGPLKSGEAKLRNQAVKSFQPANLELTALEREVALIVDGDRAAILEFQNELSAIEARVRAELPDGHFWRGPLGGEQMWSGKFSPLTTAGEGGEFFLKRLFEDLVVAHGEGRGFSSWVFGKPGTPGKQQAFPSAIEARRRDFIEGISVLKREIQQAFLDADMQPALLHVQRQRVAKLLQGSKALYSWMSQEPLVSENSLASARTRLADARSSLSSLEKRFDQGWVHPNILLERRKIKELKSILRTATGGKYRGAAGALVKAQSRLRHNKKLFGRPEAHPEVLRARDVVKSLEDEVGFLERMAPVESVPERLSHAQKRLVEAQRKLAHNEKFFAAIDGHPEVLRSREMVRAIEEEIVALDTINTWVSPRAVEVDPKVSVPRSLGEDVSPIEVTKLGPGPRYDLSGGELRKTVAANLAPETLAVVLGAKAGTRIAKVKPKAWAKYDEWADNQATLAMKAGVPIEQWMRKLPPGERMVQPRAKGYDIKPADTTEARLELAYDKWMAAQRKQADLAGLRFKDYLKQMDAERKAEGLVVRGVTESGAYAELGLHPVQAEAFAARGLYQVQKLTAVDTPRNNAKHALGDVRVPILRDMPRRYAGKGWLEPVKDIRRGYVERYYKDIPLDDMPWTKRLAYAMDFMAHPFGWLNVPKAFQNAAEWYLTNTPRQTMHPLRGGATRAQSAGLLLWNLMANHSASVGSGVMNEFIKSGHRAAFQVELAMKWLKRLEKKSDEVSVHDGLNGPVKHKVDSATMNRVVMQGAMLTDEVFKDFDMHVTIAGRTVPRGEVQAYIREVAAKYGDGAPETIAAIRASRAPENIEFVPREDLSKVSAERRGQLAVQGAILNEVAAPLNTIFWDRSSQAVLGGFRLITTDAGEVVKSPLLSVEKYVEELGSYMSAYFDSTRLARTIVGEMDEAARTAPMRNGVLDADAARRLEKGVLDRYDELLGATIEPGKKRMLSDILADPKKSPEVRSALEATRNYLGSPALRFFEHPLWKSKDWGKMRKLGLWDAREAIGEALGKLSATLETQKFFQYLRENGLLKTEADAPLVAGKSGGGPALNAAGWHQVPKEMVGALNDLGKFYVEGHTLKYLLSQGQQLAEPWLKMRQLTSVWKLVTVFNPWGTIQRNLFVNQTTLGLIPEDGGAIANPFLQPGAARVLAGDAPRNRDYRVAMREGFLKRTLADELESPFAHETRAASFEVLKRQYERMPAETGNLAADNVARQKWFMTILTEPAGEPMLGPLRMQKQRRPVEGDSTRSVINKVKSGLLKSHHYTSAFYGAIDDTAKLAYIMQGVKSEQRKLGRVLTDDEHLAVVRTWGERGKQMFLDYKDVSPVIEWMRSGLLAGVFGPFITFQYKAAGRLFEAWAQHPLTMWGFMNIIRANSAAAQIVNQTPEDLFEAVSGDIMSGFVPGGNIPEPVPPRQQRDPYSQELSIKRPTISMDPIALVSMGGLTPTVGDSPTTAAMKAFFGLVSQEDSLLSILSKRFFGGNIKRDRSDPSGYTDSIVELEDLWKVLDPASGSRGVAKLVSALMEREVGGQEGSTTGVLQGVVTGALVRDVDFIQEEKRLKAVASRADSRLKKAANDALAGRGEWAGKLEGERQKAYDVYQEARVKVQDELNARLAVTGKVTEKDWDMLDTVEEYLDKHGIKGVMRPEWVEPLEREEPEDMLRSHSAL